jgi:hypothetical protein
MKKLFICFLFALMGLSMSCATTHHGAFPKQARKAFVKIEKVIHVSNCVEGQCSVERLLTTGSGAVIKNNEFGSLVLTAAHVCESSRYRPGPGIQIEIEVLDLEMKRYGARIVTMDHEIDTCSLFVIGLDKPPLEMYYGHYEEGTRVYNVAAPVGIMNKNMVPLLNGFYLGLEGKYRALYSVPAIGGSSGSPIVTKDGKLVGMVHSVNILFPMITVSPPLESLKKFIFESEKTLQLRLLSLASD